jgi:hypothetical protein
MSVPLRKSEFIENDAIVEEELTTADLAQGKRPAATERPTADLLKEDRPGPVLASRTAAENAETAASNVRTDARTSGSDTQTATAVTQLFPTNELGELRNRWSVVQTAFVDEPRKAVEQADSLVASAMKRLAEVFADERAKLEKQWDRGDNVSTEELRVALQRYRSFFQRLLSI